MGCPASVANSNVRILQWVLLKIFNQNAELASTLAGLKTNLGIDHRNSG
jgi:hypothetical protein